MKRAATRRFKQPEWGYLKRWMLLDACCVFVRVCLCTLSPRMNPTAGVYYVTVTAENDNGASTSADYPTSGRVVGEPWCSALKLFKLRLSQSAMLACKGHNGYPVDSQLAFPCVLHSLPSWQAFRLLAASLACAPSWWKTPPPAN